MLSMVGRWIALLSLCSIAAGNSDLQRGAEAFDRGGFTAAVAQWRQMAGEAERRGDRGAQVDALVNLSAAWQMLGLHSEAVVALHRAKGLASDAPRRLAVLNALGAVCTMNPEAGERAVDRAGLGSAGKYDAEGCLAEAMKIAEELRDGRGRASVLCNLGNYHCAMRAYTRAAEIYARSVQAAAGCGAEEMAARALVGQAIAFSEISADMAGRCIAAAYERSSKLAPSYQQRLLLLSTAQTELRLGRTTVAPKAIEKVLVSATAAGDLRSLTYAQGYRARLFELAGDHAAAIEWARKASNAAQQIRLDDALYRWRWQIARSLRAQGKNDESVAAYRQAVRILANVRNDVAMANGNQQFRDAFREDVAAVYYELADLLLQREDTIAEARDTIEKLKVAELEEYLQENCSRFVRRAAAVENLGRATAVVYLIPLPDRTEMLVSLPGGLKRFRSPATQKELLGEAGLFRKRLLRMGSYEYKLSGKRLYEWTIAILRDELKSEHIETLVFVPDGELRMIPFAALWDGRGHLVEQYAVAVTPGLTLMAPRPMQRQHATILLGGLSKAVENFPPLPHVPEEIADIKSVFAGRELVDDAFIPANLEREFKQGPYSVVHIASHGHFGGSARDAYVMTYAGQLRLDSFEKLIRPSIYRGGSVDLLTLSACQTAAGNDRAALGLAGIAIKAGASSTLATLWSVNDQSTALLMTDFYRQLHDNPNFTKAQALRAAQLGLLRNEIRTMRHPYLWAPYVVVGNWL